MPADAAAWRAVSGGLEVRVRVTPRGGRDAVDGVEALSDGRKVLKVRVRAAPEDGAANDAVRRTLATAVGLPLSTVHLASGARARVKIFRMACDGAAAGEALATLSMDASCAGAAHGRGRA